MGANNFVKTDKYNGMIQSFECDLDLARNGDFKLADFWIDEETIVEYSDLSES